MLRSVAPTLWQATTNSHFFQGLPDTHGQVWVSLLWDHCSFLLSHGVHKVLFVPSKCLFPQSYVSSGGSMVGFLATSSKRAYALPSSTAPRAPAPAAVHCWPISLQETLKPSSGSASMGFLVLVHIRFVWALQPSLAGMGFNYKCNFAPLPSFGGFSFALGCGVCFLHGIQYSPVDGFSSEL